MKLTTKDYIYCEDCKTYVDFWKYDHDADDCGHKDCKWRYVTEEELKECIKDCVADGCLKKIGEDEYEEVD